MTNKHQQLLERRYFATKKEIDVIRSNATLLKWEALSKAYKLGKELWGHDFSVKRLSVDMGLPYTTTKRCLSLDNASPESWRLLKEHKISAYKLAMVCQTKATGFQDEIVAAIIQDKLSTSKIKAFKPRSIEDVNKWRHKNSIDKGYSTQDSAFRNMKNWVDRGNLFLLMPITSVGDKNKEEILDSLKLLDLKIQRYVKKNG